MNKQPTIGNFITLANINELEEEIETTKDTLTGLYIYDLITEPQEKYIIKLLEKSQVTIDQMKKQFSNKVLKEIKVKKRRKN